MASFLAENTVSVPDFVGGIFQGLTGNDDRVALNSCLKVDSVITKESEDIHTAMVSKTAIHATINLGEYWRTVSDAMATCSTMQDDIQKVSAMAVVYNHPVQLYSRTGVNFELHKVQTNKAMTNMDAAWTRADFYASGQSTASFAKYMLEPTPPAADVSHFLAGFMYKFVGDNHLEHIQNCWTDTGKVGADLSQAIDDIVAGKKIAAIEELK
jgi:hypothetical protein